MVQIKRRFTELLAIVCFAGVANASAANENVQAWGLNESGQLGNGTPNRNLPVNIAGLTNLMAVSAGAGHSIALKRDGTVWAWGANHYGQLGNGSNVDYSDQPVAVSDLSGAVVIAAGQNHNLALTNDGTV